MEAVCFPETMASTDEYTRRQNQECYHHHRVKTTNLATINYSHRLNTIMDQNTVMIIHSVRHSISTSDQHYQGINTCIKPNSERTPLGFLIPSYKLRKLQQYIMDPTSYIYVKTLFFTYFYNTFPKQCTRK